MGMQLWAESVPGSKRNQSRYVCGQQDAASCRVKGWFRACGIAIVRQILPFRRLMTAGTAVHSVVNSIINEIFFHCKHVLKGPHKYVVNNLIVHS
jgi:hypothetical protein